jgi:cytochrome c peroxidase
MLPRRDLSQPAAGVPAASGPTPAIRWAAGLALLLALVGCGGGGSGGAPDTPPAAPLLSEAAQLGEAIFHDASLSASGRMSCATCHAADRGHASPFPTPVAMGGARLDQPGTRNPPSLRYLRFNGAFSLPDGGRAVGGFNWDGRAATLQEQARGPFLSPVEMANRDVGEVVARLAAAPYAERFRAVFGEGILRDPEAAFERMTFALQQFQQEAPEFAPFTSKFDAVNAGRASFTAREANGLDLFNRADKGNCALCHSSTRPANAPAALFTAYGYSNLGVPRNAAIAANADAAFFDGGLCGGARTDLAARTELCGSFKVPSLRNVALRTRFFHNGVFDSLQQVVRFYARRDTDPAMFYSTDALGNPVAYDDLPPDLRDNVLTRLAPFNRTPAEGPALTEREIDDIVVFLRTLNDGYVPPK